MELKKENAQTLMEHFKGDYQIKEFTDRINSTIESMKDLVSKINNADDLPGNGVFEGISGQALFIMDMGRQLRSMKRIKEVAESK